MTERDKRRARLQKWAPFWDGDHEKLLRDLRDELDDGERDRKALAEAELRGHIIGLRHAASAAAENGTHRGEWPNISESQLTEIADRLGADLELPPGWARDNFGDVYRTERR